MNIQGLSEKERQHLREQIRKKEVVTQAELAFIWGTTRQTLFNMRKAGLPYYRLNSEIRFKISEVESFMRRNNSSVKSAA
jgi:hypothetical protein